MKIFNLKNCTTWLATWMSVLTMSITPVAMGQEAQNITKKQVQAALEQMGLNKSSTVGQFYEKNKSIFPERIRKEIEPILANYKNVMMPEFQVTSATGPDGREIPNVTMSQAGQLINIQWFGSKDKFVKFQNTNLTEVDIVNFTDMVSRILAGDAVLRKQNEFSQKQVSNQFTELPVLDAALWKKMTMEERVSYIVQIRHLWLDAKNILWEKNKLSKNKRTASNDVLEKIFAVFTGLQAEAAGKATAKTTPTPFSKPASSYISGQSCIVAGYSANYNNGYCDHTKLLETTYSKSSFVTDMNAKCASTDHPNDIACNPLIYGTPGGQPKCITPERSNKEFQIATHFGGPCDKASRLQSSQDEIKFLKDDSKKKLVGRYDPENLSMTDDERKELFRKDQEKNGFAETKAFIEGVLKVNDPQLLDVFAKGVINDAVIEQLNGIQKLFNTEIADATKACRAAANDKAAKHEANFIGACDQLQRRFLFISDLLKSKCETGSTINQSTLKCTCSTQVEVFPGASCKAAAPATPPPVATEPPKDKPKDKPSKDGKCASGEREERVVGTNSGAEAVTCVAIKVGKTPPAAAECGALCVIGKGLKFALPVILGAVGIYAMYKLFSPKKPALNPAGDACPNGVIPPCAAVCQVPLANVNGICACAACPPGQTISSAATCTCSTTTTTTMTYTCWDGVTKVSDLALCPAQKYTCWDGSVVSNSINCPEKPETTTTTTTTSGKTGR